MCLFLTRDFARVWRLMLENSTWQGLVELSCRAKKDQYSGRTLVMESQITETYPA